MIVRHTEGGQSWAELSRLDPLAGVLDPADERGGKNRLIDRVHKRALARIAGNLSGRVVLDFGCGTGRLSEWLVRRGALVEGVDVTPEMVEVARRRVPGGTFQVIDGLTLPFGVGTFDLVVTAYVLQYYLRTDSTIPRELARVIRPGGRLVGIEQVMEQDLGRGGNVGAYKQVLVDAGLLDFRATMIRLGDSRIVDLARRHPWLSRLPVAPWFVEREAARGAEASVRDHYVDAVLRAERPL